MGSWQQIAITLVLVIALISFSANADFNTPNKIKFLPGLKEIPNFDQYSGYITVDQASNRSLFYWFVESQRNPSSDPLLVWMNGGPGASSLMGLLSEHGPFRPTNPNQDPQELDVNPYSWNQIANIIYLECPAGVGFSFSDNPADYTTNDSRTAQDNYNFLLGWFNQFPQFKTNDFYVTGESYGGHYVPELANLILEGNQNLTTDQQINVKGILVGNPGIDDDWYYNIDEYAFVSFLYQRALIPQHAYTDAALACGWDNFLTNCGNNYTNTSTACNTQVNNALTYVSSIDIDFYDVYAPVCTIPVESRLPLGQYASRKGRSVINKLPPPYPQDGFQPCLENWMVPYLNQPSVQAALGVLPTKWALFGNITYGSELEFMIPLFQKFINQTNWRILVYSGDADSAVPFIGTQRWIQCLEQPITRDWTRWYYQENIAGGFIEYEGISFLTVKGSGHMVPWYTPDLAYAFFERWLQNKNMEF